MMAENFCVNCKVLDFGGKCASCENYIPYKKNEMVPDSRCNTLKTLAESVLAKLENQGFCIIDRFHNEKAQAILNEVQCIHDSGLMKNGQLSNTLTSENIRGDLIAWVNGREKGMENIGVHMKRCDALVRELNKLISYHTIEGRTQGMISCYPGAGKRYRKHVDNPNQDGRLITVLYYLNKNYDSIINGGELRLYPHGGEEYVDIEPIFDRLFLFWSDRRNPHEVLPTHTTRFAITLWYFDKHEREAEFNRLRTAKQYEAK